MADTINSLNESLFWFINRSPGPLFDYLIIAITCTAYTIPAFLIGIGAMKLYKGLNKRNIWLLFFTLALGGLIVQGIKQVYVKDRPLGHFGEISPELKAKVHAPFRQPHHRTFPSGHTQTAFGVAAIILLLFKRHYALWILWAVLVGFSRVNLGVHFPIDIVFGALFGVLSAWGIYSVSTRQKLETSSKDREPD